MRFVPQAAAAHKAAAALLLFTKAVMQKISVLNRHTLLFPLALVLFEFSVYIGNDMVQPAMLEVLHEFGVGSRWVSSSMTAYLIGGAMLQWLLGPLSDRIGRRPVMLGGAAFFAVSCLVTLWSNSIESFLVLRFIQGMGLCFITAVGYAAVQEAFEEKTAIKVVALMANVAMIAPLLGPVGGAALLEVGPWRLSFILIGASALLAWFGLWSKMPETVQKRAEPLPLADIGRDYLSLMRNSAFLASVAVLPMMGLSLLGWIALSPVMLMEDAGMTPMQYGLAQIPVFSALIAGNLLLVRLTDKQPLGRTVSYGIVSLMAGALVMLAGSALSPLGAALAVMAGCSLMCLGHGLCYAVLYRFALTVTDISKGTVAASVGMLTIVAYAVFVEVFKLGYFGMGVLGFALLSLASALLFWWLARKVVAGALRDRELETASQQA